MSLRDAIERMVEKGEGYSPGHYVGRDWWALSEEEEFVFQIARDRWPRMLVALTLYQTMAGQVAPADMGFEPALIEAERKARAIELSEAGFTALARDLVGLTMRECHAVWWKADFCAHREGLIRYRDEE